MYVVPWQRWSQIIWQRAICPVCMAISAQHKALNKQLPSFCILCVCLGGVRVDVVTHSTNINIFQFLTRFLVFQIDQFTCCLPLFGIKWYKLNWTSFFNINYLYIVFFMSLMFLFFFLYFFFLIIFVFFVP